MSKKNNFATKLALLPLAVSLTMTAGCFVSDSSDRKTPVNVLEVRAIDGYMVNAQVCLDLNLNKVCDAGEPTAYTTAGGIASIAVFADSDLNAPLIGKAVQGTIDEDYNAPVDENLLMSAPPKSRVVSPFSTLIMNRIEATYASGDTSKPIDTLVAEFSAQLATDLGLPAGTDLTKVDYVAEMKKADVDETVRRQFATAYVVGQVLANQIIETMKQVEEQALAPTPADRAAALNVVLSSINNTLAAVVNTVTAAIGGLDLQDIVTNPQQYVLDTVKTVVAQNPIAPPSKEQIEEQKKADEKAKEALDKQIENPTQPQPPTGGTGGTGGSGGSSVER